MDSFIQWLADLMFVAETHQIIAAAIITAIIAIFAAAAMYLVRLWQKDKSEVAPQIDDVAVRTRLYLQAIEFSSAATRGRNQEYLRDAIERWTAQKARTWTDFQLYLAVRQMERQRRNPRLAGNFAIEQLTRSLRAALVASPGDPDMNPASALLNNGIATLFGMRPAVRHDASLRSRSPEAESVSQQDWHPFAVLGLPDPCAMESRIQPMLNGGPPDVLLELLEAIEAACREYGFVTFGGSQILLAEMVVWILHEEWLGPTRFTPEERMLREVSIQLTPQLPQFLRCKPLRAIEETGADQLRIAFEAGPPTGGGDDAVFNLDLQLEYQGRYWAANSVDFEIGTAAELIFRRTNSMRRRKTLMADRTPSP